MRPNSPAAEHGGRKEGPGAVLIHVRPGQIIYHLAQTNSVLDSLSEEGGCAREVREGCQRRCSLTPITLPLISLPWPPPHYSTHAASGRGRRPRPRVPVPRFLPLRHVERAAGNSRRRARIYARGARPTLRRGRGRREPGGGGGGAGVRGAAAGLWEADRSASLTHSIAQAARGAPINKQSLWLPRASCLKSQSSMKWPLLNYWDGRI